MRIWSYMKHTFLLYESYVIGKPEEIWASFNLLYALKLFFQFEKFHY